MLPTDPQVRARYMQIFLRRIDQLFPADRDAIQAAAPRWMFDAIREGGPLEWLPAEVNVELTLAVYRRLAPDDAHHFFKHLLINAFNSPLLNAFVETAFRVTGRDPAQALKWLPKGASLMFKNWGIWRVVDSQATHAALEIDRMPDACFDPAGLYLSSVRDSLHSVYVRAGLEGRVEIAERDPLRRRVRFDFDWS